MNSLAERPLDAVASTLIAVAREAIAAGERPQPMQWPLDWLREPGASFVTLRMDGELRGCIGSVDARRPLGDDVAYNAYAAAYRDPRFAPLEKGELANLAVEVSVLSARVPFAAASEEGALAALRPGVDGVYLEFDGTSATFLPQVWENLPEPLDFLTELRRKAGLPPRFWSDRVKLSRYTVDKYK
ncbi:MAG TPA: AmmeMemoRadiSam system protein A [Usitatibacter sp.]|nr:AmmeMemoRadiSam system protein A [Usitatibacter sp.]